MHLSEQDKRSEPRRCDFFFFLPLDSDSPLRRILTRFQHRLESNKIET